MSWLSASEEYPRYCESNSPVLDAGVAFQVNSRRRVLSGKKWALYGEINFVASPLREVSSSVNAATHDFASLLITPGIRVKFRPTSRISPHAVVGGGYADYEQAMTLIDGRPNQASREFSRRALEFGAGADVHIWRFVALRGEARDFYTGSPTYNIPSIWGGRHNSGRHNSGQRNIGAAGACVLRWH